MNRLTQILRCAVIITNAAVFPHYNSSAQQPDPVATPTNTWATKIMESPHESRGTNAFLKADLIPRDVIDDCSWWIEYLLKKQYRPQDFIVVTEFVRDPKPQRDQVWTRLQTMDGAQIQLMQACGHFTLAIRPAWKLDGGIPTKEDAENFIQKTLKAYLDQGDEAARSMTEWSRLEDQAWHFTLIPPTHSGWMENSDVYTDGTVVSIHGSKWKPGEEDLASIRNCYGKLEHWFDPPDKRPREPYRAQRVPGYTDLYYAIREGVNNRDVSQAKDMMATNVSLVSATTDPWGDKPLHMAAGYGSKELVEFLLAHGADLEARDKSGRTPLDVAATYDRKEALEVLIAAGADINAKDNEGATPLDHAEQLGRAEAIKILRAHGAKATRPEIPAGSKAPIR